MVDLPRRVRKFLVGTAGAVQGCVGDPSSPAFGRLYSQLDEHAEMDDPLAVLERQTVIDDVCTAVIETAGRARLSDAEAEAWLRMLGMAVMITGANAGIATEDDVDRVPPALARLLDLLRSLQLLLAHCLDPELGDPEAVTGGTGATGATGGTGPA